MVLRPLMAAALVIGMATPALAFHCPADIKAIDAALPKTQLSQAQKDQVMTLRNEGEALHKSGAHKESVDKLSEAMRIILNNM